MAFYPSAAPQAYYAPTPSSRPRPTVGTVPYDIDYNRDLTDTKVYLRKLLKREDFANVRPGFPFNFVCDASGRSAMSYQSYDFQFRDHFRSLQQKSAGSARFVYTSHGRRPDGMMDWSIIVPDRQSTRYEHHATGHVSIAHVQINPLVMETEFGLPLMTDPRIVQEALALSLEMGVMITIQMISEKMALYGTGQIVFLTTDKSGKTSYVCSYKA